MLCLVGVWLKGVSWAVRYLYKPQWRAVTPFQNSGGIARAWQMILDVCPKYGDTIYNITGYCIYTCVSSRHSQKDELVGLRWKQKLNWHSRVENRLFSLRNHIFRQFNLQKCWTIIFPKQVELLTSFQNWELGLSFSYHLVLNLNTFRCYTLYVWDFCLHQPLLVMLCRGEPQSTTVKAFMA